MTAVGWQRAEGALALAGGLGLVGQLADYAPLWPWWALVLVFFAPDLGMIGYLAGPRAGAVGYNLLHLYGAGLAMIVAGVAIGSTIVVAAGSLWMAHVGLDRMLGYGLKSMAGFRDTHLGPIGRD